MLMDDVEEILEESGYTYCEYSGCFDIAARRKDVVLLKVLTNVDSFQEEQANNLKVLSRSLEASSFLVGLHTRRERLSNNVIYDRFDVPTVTPKTLDSILGGLMPCVYRFRGGLFAEINPKALRDARENAGMSQSELAESVGITKKSLYEHEAGKQNMEHRNAVRIEKMLRVRITVPVSARQYDVASAPRSSFERGISRKFKSMGFETDSVYQSPFNMIAKEKSFLLLSDVEEKKNRIQKNIPYISDFSKVTKKSAIVITNEEISSDIPTLREDELPGLKPRDIRKLLKKW